MIEISINGIIEARITATPEGAGQVALYIERHVNSPIPAPLLARLCLRHLRNGIDLLALTR